MPLPDVLVKVLSALQPTTRPTSTATAFYVAQTPRGWAKKPRLCRSLTDVVAFFGERQSATFFYDWADTFFNEGGAELFISRAVHADAAPGKLILADTGAKKVATIEAGSLGEAEPGAWSGTTGLKLKIEIVNTVGPPETFVIKVFIKGEATPIEESPALESVAALIGWANANSNYLKASVASETNVTGAKLPKTLASTELTEVAATDGSAVTDSDYKEALERIARELGPGQVAMETGNAGTTTRQVYLLEHAAERNRFALLDGADTATVATLTAQATALYAATVTVQGLAVKARRYGQLFAPWDLIPGITPNTQRTVPPSARQAAAYARNDANGNPNRAAAGGKGTARYVSDLSQVAFTDAQRLTLNNAGITVSRRRFGNAIATWGMRTLADQVADVEWSVAANVRCIMAFTAKAEAAMEAYEFDQVDGFGSMLSKVTGDLTSIAADLFAKGALFGKTPLEAFSISAGEALNPPAALREGRVTVEADLRVSPAAEQITIRIVKIPITQALA